MIKSNNKQTNQILAIFDSLEYIKKHNDFSYLGNDYNIDDIKDSYKDLKLKNKDNQKMLKILEEAYETISYELLYNKDEDDQVEYAKNKEFKDF